MLKILLDTHNAWGALIIGHRLTIHLSKDRTGMHAAPKFLRGQQNSLLVSGKGIVSQLTMEFEPVHHSTAHNGSVITLERRSQ